MAAQGWKLHLSASQASADDVLHRALPVLLAERASFKITASYDELNDLNEGNGGLSQVGKFLTVYPDDDAHAVRLARRAGRSHARPVGSADPVRPAAARWQRRALPVRRLR